MAQLIPDGDVVSWGKQINGGVIRRGLINCAFKKPMVAEVQGVPVYCCADRVNADYKEYVAFDTIRKQLMVTFYAQVRGNQHRKGLLHPDLGVTQTLIWKYEAWMLHSGFATDFMLDVLLVNRKAPFIISDFQQTSYGRNMWLAVMATAMKRGYQVFYGIYDGSNMLISLDDVGQIVDHYPYDIVQSGVIYQNRCAIILNKNEDIKSYLADPESVRILTNAEAESLRIYE